ncbi:MAG: family 10 glycosylhydrolase [Victivallales bacterium]
MDYISSVPQQYLYSAIVVLLLLLAVVTVAGGTEMLRGKAERRKVRGVWVATVGNIDFHKHKKRNSFRQEFLEVVSNLAENKFNTLIFQVRPSNDAFYKSALNPWSRYLCGREGEEIPGFDPLKFMVKAAHKYGLEFHAWLNPYRVNGSTPLRKAEYLKTLDPGNFARQHPELVLEIPLDDGSYQLILNPGEPEVIKFIVDTVGEIVANYEVDAIHFDDYFYPYSGIGNIDAETCSKNNPQNLSVDDWRRENINRMVRDVHECLKLSGRKVKFGISPFGIWANRKNNPAGSPTNGAQSFYEQFADSRYWIKEGWIDYIAPQLYWEFAHETAPYAALVDWWAEQVKNTQVDLYIGQAVYRLGSSRAWENRRELVDQLRYNSKRKTVKGSVLFSYSCVFFPKNRYMKQGVEELFKVW